MFRVQHKTDIHDPGHQRVRLHPVVKHVKKVRCITEVGSGTDRIIADTHLLPHGDQCRHTRQDANRLAMHILITFVAWNTYLYRNIIGVKHAKTGDGCLQHFHRVPGDRRGLHNVTDVVFYPAMLAQLPVEALKLLRCWQLTIQQQVGGLFVGTVLGQIDNPVTAVGQDALLAIQVGDT